MEKFFCRWQKIDSRVPEKKICQTYTGAQTEVNCPYDRTDIQYSKEIGIFISKETGGIEKKCPDFFPTSDVLVDFSSEKKSQ